MDRKFCLSIVFAVFLFEAAVVHGQDEGVLATIDCGSVQGILIDIAISDIAQWDTSDADDVDAWALNSKTDASSCKPTFNQGAGQVQYAAFSVENCADEPTVSADGTKLEYEFIINVNAAGGPGSPITYSYDHQYSIKCFYNRERENLMASFEPLPLLTASGEDTNDFTISFTLHYGDGPQQDAEIAANAVIDLGTPIYGKVTVDDTGFPNLDIHFRSVTASEDSGGLVNPVTLVTDGCGDATSIVDDVECDANADDRFNMIDNGAFRYPGQAAPANVYFRTTVLVCLADNVGTECKTECTACAGDERERRETVKEIHQTLYYLSAGPYRFENVNKDSAVGKDQGTALPTYVIAIVAVCGIAAIAIISAVVVIALRQRRKNTTTAKPRDAGVTA